ncbi:hypothetical protein ACIQXQ_11220 [Peribacillus sp. NPDC097198]|uniref:hypothetical protein n=1 Tax=Peribacillus sp. NPDC097198 TaxID=3364397 RepID=UPI00380B89E5
MRPYPTWFTYVVKVLWLAGLFVLLVVSYTLGLTIQKKVEATFIIEPLFWFDSVVPLVFGLYVSLLFVKGWTFKLQMPLFICVTLPCLILSLYVPIVYTFFPNAAYFPDPYWLLTRDSFRIIPVVAGLTLFTSLFGVKRDSMFYK